MHLEDFVYIIIDYEIVEVEQCIDYQNNNILRLYVQYSHKMKISHLKTHQSVTLLFVFDENENLYKLTTKDHSEIRTFLVLDNLLTIKMNNYYLTKTSLLRLI